MVLPWSLQEVHTIDTTEAHIIDITADITTVINLMVIKPKYREKAFLKIIVIISILYLGLSPFPDGSGSSFALKSRSLWLEFCFIYVFFLREIRL